MATHENVIWSIHAGKTGDADSLFPKTGFVAIGWARCGDLGRLPPDREAYRHHFSASYPDEIPGAVPVKAGQLYRFVHEMKNDDLVIYPSKRDHLIHIGRVTGEYKYNPDLEPEYPHLRPVEWLKSIPWAHFTQGALYEIGNAMSLVHVKNHADEVLAELKGEDSVATVDRDAMAEMVAEDIEQVPQLPS